MENFINKFFELLRDDDFMFAFGCITVILTFLLSIFTYCYTIPDNVKFLDACNLTCNKTAMMMDICDTKNKICKCKGVR